MRKEVMGPEKPAILGISLENTVSHNSAISEINIVSKIIVPISKEFFICKHLEKAWCWEKAWLLQMQFQGLWVTNYGPLFWGWNSYKC